MLRSVLGVVLGFLLLFVMVAVNFAAIGFIAPTAYPEPGSSERPGFAMMGYILTTDVLFMAISGYVTALVARRSPVKHALILGAVLVLLGGVTLAFTLGQEPVWYQIARLVLTLPATAAGGYARSAMGGS